MQADHVPRGRARSRAPGQSPITCPGADRRSASGSACGQPAHFSFSATFARPAHSHPPSPRWLCKPRGLNRRRKARACGAKVVTQPFRMRASCLRPFDANGRCHDGALLGMPPVLGCDHSLLRWECAESEGGGVRPRNRCGRSPQPGPTIGPGGCGARGTSTGGRPSADHGTPPTRRWGTTSSLPVCGGGWACPPASLSARARRLSIRPIALECGRLGSDSLGPYLLQG